MSDPDARVPAAPVVPHPFVWLVLYFPLGLGAAALVGQLRPVADRPGGEQVRGPGLRLAGGARPAGQLKFDTVAGTRSDLGLNEAAEAVGHILANQLVDHETVRSHLTAR